MWPRERRAKTPPRPIYQQVAVTLYVLGSVGGGGLERSRIALNISKGAVGIYLWCTLAVPGSFVHSSMLSSYFAPFPQCAS
ncbi:hypothetical protein EV426DRAFT_626490 [Tirmania nivea]|nr:hypothetical protein EV426DRAFT_626490 [Tirmania nivea]